MDWPRGRKNPPASYNSEVLIAASGQRVSYALQGTGVLLSQKYFSVINDIYDMSMLSRARTFENSEILWADVVWMCR